jgi:hypothetical protein
MTLQTPYNVGELVASQTGLNTKELVVVGMVSKELDSIWNETVAA